MEYKLEEVLPVTAKLAKKFTSNESSSVSYETANQLMEAALYCIRECESKGEDTMLEGRHIDCMTAYQKGYEIVLEKAEQAKRVYHRMLDHFEDYGCQNYRDTIIKGIPAFFLHYDPVFEPQNHILTLDYPVTNLSETMTGIDLILDYLIKAEYEQEFLQHFSREGIINLLEFTRTDYEELYFENICIPVLLRAAACIIGEEELYQLELSKEGQKLANDFFTQVKLETGVTRFYRLLEMVETSVMKEKNTGNFKHYARDFAVRMQNGAVP
jgi:hypothetical protein